jgi:hypothetical protein
MRSDKRRMIEARYQGPGQGAKMNRKDRSALDELSRRERYVLPSHVQIDADSMH